MLGLGVSAMDFGGLGTVGDSPPSPSPFTYILGDLTLTLTKDSETGVVLAWTESENAVGYRVVRDDFVIDVGKRRDFAVGSLPAGTHNFWIVPYLNASDSNTTPKSNVQTVVLAGAPVPLAVTLTPTLLTVTKLDETAVRLTWNPVNGATGYYVIRNGYTVDSVGQTTYTIGSLGAGQNDFWVVPYVNVNDNNKTPASNVVSMSLVGNNSGVSSPPYVNYKRRKRYDRLPPEYVTTPPEAATTTTNTATTASDVTTDSIIDTIKNHYLVVTAIAVVGGYFVFKK